MDAASTVQPCIGTFSWCGMQPSGYYLSLRQGRFDYKDKRLMVYWKITMNPKLFAMEIDSIHIYDPSGFLAQYSPGAPGITSTLFFSTKEEWQGNTFNVKFIKWLPRRPGAHPLSRSPSQTIFETQVVIPTIAILGDQQDCAICLDPVPPNTTELFVSPCKHLLHMSCLWNYLVRTDQLVVNPQCTEAVCGHSPGRPTHFKCPVCRKLIKNGTLPA
jgi:hypothetical protein